MTIAIKAIDPKSNRKKTIISINGELYRSGITYDQAKKMQKRLARILIPILNQQGFKKTEIYDTDYSPRNWRP